MFVEGDVLPLEVDGVKVGTAVVKAKAGTLWLEWNGGSHILKLPVFDYEREK